MPLVALGWPCRVRGWGWYASIKGSKAGGFCTEQMPCELFDGVLYPEVVDVAGFTTGHRPEGIVSPQHPTSVPASRLLI